MTEDYAARIDLDRTRHHIIWERTVSRHVYHAIEASESVGELPVKVTVFDGADCIGGNKIHLGFGDHGVLFDFGTNFNRMNQYYDEFLQPRSSRGIHDYLDMGLIPRVNWYREDLVPDDVDLSGAPDLSADALLISHAHIDHFGCAGFLDLNIPFVATPMTAALIKAVNDCGRADPGAECAYCTIKGPGNDRRTVVSGKGSYVARDFLLTERHKSGFEDFWTNSKGKTKGLEPGELGNMTSLELEIKAMEVDHSIYGATAYAVETPAGWVVYSGDIRLHGAYGEKTRRFMSDAKALSPAALIIEGTRTGRDDSHFQLSEADVASKCRAAAEDVEGLVIADFSARNFERLDAFIEIARRAGRSLVVTIKDAYFLEAMRLVDGVDRLSQVLVYGELKSRGSKVKDSIEEQIGRLVDPKEISMHPWEHILCFSSYDMGNLLDIRPDGGRYIYSSSEAHSEDQVFDFVRLHRWITRFGMEAFGFKEDKGTVTFEPGYHASGHASAEDLANVVETIDPDLVIPVHTLRPEFFQESGRNVALPVPGVPVYISR
jgi:ribonuclease J